MTNFKVDIESIYGVFIRPQLSAGALHVYALAGVAYTNIRLRASTPSLNIAIDTNDSDKDFAWGGGVQLDLGKNLGVSVSYTQYLEDVESASAGVVYRF